MIDTVSFWNFCEKFGPKVVIIYLTTKFFLKNRFFYTSNLRPSTYLYILQSSLSLGEG